MALTKESFLPDQEDCAETWRSLRWPDGPECVECGAANVMVQDRCYSGGLRRYECRACGRWFTDRSGTFLEHSKIQLPVWVYLLREMQKGRAPGVIEDEVPCSERTVRRLIKDLRKAICEKRPEWVAPLTGKPETVSTGESHS